MRALSFALTVACVLASSSSRALPAEFIKPPAIAANVAFWKRVYAEWHVNDIALHDEEDLSMVYRVVRVPARGDVDEKGRNRKQAIAAATAEVTAALRSLQKKNPKDATGLSGLEKEIFLALKDNQRPDKYARINKIRAQNGLLERFIQGYQNSGLYEQFITAELQRNGLPKELIGVAFVESLFYTGARSKVGAAGVWQFMSYTGREYMQINHVVDERWDPILATEAAAKYLKQAKKELVTWPLAITSYNYGRGGMRALANAAGTNDFGVILAVTKGKRFGFAARNYYASFLAISEILEEAHTRLAGINKKPAWTYDVVRLPFSAYAGQVTGTGVLDQATFEWLNPALTDDAARGKLPLPHGISLRVPKGRGPDLLARLDALPAAEKQRAARAVKAIHTATGKQTVADIARKYALAPDVLAARTGLDVTAVPAKGQKVPIPPPQARYSLLPEARGMPMPPLGEAPPVLVADAALLPAPEPEATARPAAPRRREPPSTVLTGVVKVRVSAREPVVRTLPGVDVVAGAAALLPGVDVVAGVSPLLQPPSSSPAPVLSTTTIEDAPAAQEPPGET